MVIFIQRAISVSLLIFGVVSIDLFLADMTHDNFIVRALMYFSASVVAFYYFIHVVILLLHFLIAMFIVLRPIDVGFVIEKKNGRFVDKTMLSVKISDFAMMIAWLVSGNAFFVILHAMMIIALTRTSLFISNSAGDRNK